MYLSTGSFNAKRDYLKHVIINDYILGKWWGTGFPLKNCRAPFPEFPSGRREKRLLLSYPHHFVLSRICVSLLKVPVTCWMTLRPLRPTEKQLWLWHSFTGWTNLNSGYADEIVFHSSAALCKLCGAQNPALQTTFTLIPMLFCTDIFPLRSHSVPDINCRLAFGRKTGADLVGVIIFKSA